MSERDALLASISNTVGDYRSGEIAAPTPEHFARWVNQFHSRVRIPMLREIDHVLKQTYLSRETVSDFLTKLVTNEKLAGSAPRNFWRKTNFLRIQAQGNSQTEILSLFDTVLKFEYGFRTNACGESGGHFVYLDDAMFSGNRAGSDLEKWIREDAPSQTTVHVIVMATHTFSEYQVRNRLRKVLTETGKAIQIQWWYRMKIENRKSYRSNAGVLWPARLPDDDGLNSYLAMHLNNPFKPRVPGGSLDPFSSEEGRQLLENEFTLAGIKIRSFSQSPSDVLRPLGFSPFNLGFGSMIVTFRNCPNNCPLALWWGAAEAPESHPFSNWYPLFPRKTYDYEESEMALSGNRKNQIRTYQPANSVVFFKTKEKFGGLSNMASGFPLRVNNNSIRTSEALYQACRFPHMPEVQRQIIAERSPMTAKMRGKPYRQKSRDDWNTVRVRIMRWCLRVKLAQNWQSFSQLLLETGDQPIVERSKRDDFWGAKDTGDGLLVGTNVLGRLLMKLREQLKADTGDRLKVVAPPAVLDFLLFEDPIKTTYGGVDYGHPSSSGDRGTSAATPHGIAEVPQTSFFERPINQQEKQAVRHTQSSKSNYKENLQPYPAYCDSGLSWLGRIPKHWEVRKLKQCAERFYAGGTPDSGTESYYCAPDYGIPWLMISDMTGQRKILKTAKAISESGRSSKGLEVLPIGTLLYSMYASLGITSMLQIAACVNQAIIGVKLKQSAVNNEFGLYFLETLRPHVIQRASASTQANLNAEKVRTLPIFLPPLPEQVAIVRYLDYVDRRIRRYIGAKQKLIELLEEQKQVIIHRAVTRGLDPYAPLKDSGVEWLGEVPAHWDVQRLKENVANIINHTIDRKTGELYVALEHIESWTGRIRETGPDVNFDSQVKRFQVGDVLFGKLRPYLAKVARPNRKGVCVGEFLVLRVRGKNIDANYLCFLLRSKPIIDAINASTYGARMPRADWSFIGNIKQPLPPLGEQIAIIEYLDKATANIDTTISRARREIELLDEYRTRLIADVVTGKVDVREVAALLPEKPAELVPLDGPGELERAKQLDHTLNTAYADSSAEQPQIAAGETTGTYLP